jgi:hypothetical protein
VCYNQSWSSDLGYLGLVKETSLLLALALVEGSLGGALGRVALESRYGLVRGISDILLGLVESRLARVRSDCLLGLGGEIFASSVRHFPKFVRSSGLVAF